MMGIQTFRRVGIVGLGLMGGSLARALKSRPSPPSITAMSRDRGDLESALADGAVDDVAGEPSAFFRGADLVVYCTPLNATLDLLEAHRGFFSSDTVITDVVSLKAPVLRRAAALGLGGSFVGSHPMAGGEGSGYSHSRAELFSGATVWLVPGRSEKIPEERVRNLWLSLGAHPRNLEAEEHDDLMARASHVPQLVANALASVMAQEGLSRMDLGPGGRDMTRLAGSSPEMWRDLLEHPPGTLVPSLRSLEILLKQIRESVEEGRVDELAELMDRTRAWWRG